MFLPVHRLLADEAGDPPLEVGIGDPVGESADRSDEAFLAGRECTRQTGDEVPLPEGAKQVDYVVALVNDLASPVRIQVVEKPATPMQWDLIRSSIPCTETTRALTFDLTLPMTEITHV